jgi:hypothetical protein
MKSSNKYGVYEKEHQEAVVRYKRAEAYVTTCHCDDGFYRYGYSLSHSHGGMSSPISHHDVAYPTRREAMDAGIAKLLKCFPASYPDTPQTVKKELETMRGQLEALLLQPCLL